MQHIVYYIYAMSSSHQKGGSRSKQNIQKEDVIQAVVIADSFNNRFAPLTCTTPRALLPLVNAPILDYTLECLGNAGVQEVILFCSSHADKIKEHVKKSKWNEASTPMTVNIIVSEDCSSLGDAMRDIDAKGIIRGDFVLLHGDLVSNAQLLPILEWHKKIQKQDKGAVMTLVYTSASPGHKLRSPEEEVVIALDGQSNRILFHQRVGGMGKVSFPLEMLLSSERVEVWHDVLDPGIAICSPAVPPLFSDNFDFQSVDDLVRDLLVNEEVLTSTMYCHRLRGEYAARVLAPRFYHAISRDIIHRWTFPLVPDGCVSQDLEPYMFLRNYIYKQKNVSVAKGCNLQEDVVIGFGTTVGEKSELARCVIGRNCKIGTNVSLTDCFIWDNVEIQNGCSVRFSIVSNNVILKEGVSLQGNCILGPNVQVEPGTSLKEMSVVSEAILQRRKNDFGDFKEQQFEKLGPKAYVYKPLEDSDLEEEGEDTEAKVKEWSRFHKLEVSSGEEEEEEDIEKDFREKDGLSNENSPIPDDTSIFFSEVLESLVRGVDEKLHYENLILEINSSRYAYNITVKEVNFLVVRSLLSIPQAKQEKQKSDKPKEKPSSQQLYTELASVFQYSMPILKNYIKNEEAQLDCLQAIEEHAVESAEFREIAMKMLHFLYDKDILAEDTLIKWYDDFEIDSEEAKHFYSKVTPFIHWLQEADEDSESD
ncbi:hypothetical protein J437_LFUL015888 [Ladona fulva]|uniref:Translation initiation factor eIF2B subunit epsilon n=1 Tax=Ladona fulva TaxID=123851 RepID=A0A8K0JU39_LADFU|nr:hypothetical protein J437_LFUL015888 [Ladona fulva]